MWEEVGYRDAPHHIRIKNAKFKEPRWDCDCDFLVPESKFDTISIKVIK